MQRTFVLVKPDAVARGVPARILAVLEEAGLRIVKLQMRRLSRKEAQELYAPHRGKEFFGPLVDFITSGPVAGAVLEGRDAVERVRELIGPTNPLEAPPDTIRGRWGTDITQNAIHASDSPESARREAGVFFGSLD